MHHEGRMRAEELQNDKIPRNRPESDQRISLGVMPKRFLNARRKDAALL